MVEMKPLIFGTGLSSSKDYDTSFQVVLTSIKGGIRRFDTAPSYGTEQMLGDILHRCCNELHLNRENLYIQTKIDAWQMQEGKISDYVEQALSKMGLKYFDVLLIHWPVPEYLEYTWEKMVKLHEEGLVKSLGVCNVRMRQLKKMIEWDVKPQIIQIERNPLRTCLNEVEFCHEHNLTVQAYSPLCKMDARIRDNLEIQAIANKYGKNIGQVVLRWHIDTSVIPVFTSTKVTRIQDYVDLDDFILTDGEIQIINDLNEDYKMYLEACACPGF